MTSWSRYGKIRMGLNWRTTRSIAVNVYLISLLTLEKSVAA